jgi:hypothetical protein
MDGSLFRSFLIALLVLLQLGNAHIKEQPVKLASKSFAAAYLILVIIPILGLAGVLRSGRNLIAPSAIGGRWKMQANAPSLAPLPCAESVATMRGVDFTIVQSGKYVTLRFANPVLPSTSGLIEGKTIRVSMSLPAKGMKEAGCSGEHVFSLIATLDSKTNPNSMAGLLSVNGCAACSPAEFRAIREQ